MSRFAKRRCLRVVALSAIAGLLISSGKLFAAQTGEQLLTLKQTVLTEAEPNGQAAQPAEQAPVQPIYMADGGGPNIHGFLNIPFKSAYVTPRGLVVENQGLVVQPIIGLVFPTGDFGFLKDTAIVTGIWQSFNSNQGDPKVGCWNEVDYFLSFAGKVGDFAYTLSYGAWFFPQSTEGKPDTEHNIDLKIQYGDKWFDGFSLNPYVDLWWAVGGSSTVVLGEEGGTGYVELGIVPTKTFMVGSDLPLTFTFPVYFSVGPEGYWDASGDFGGGNCGVFSASANVSMPLPIPKQYGNWHVDAGISYFYLLNDALLEAGDILSGNDDRNVFVGSIGVGVNF